ncbi:MAG: PspC domain-containing protein [Calditrichaeota bacterium]|nr:PspC domain-containing protein [Calditrichota bacterium]
MKKLYRSRRDRKISGVVGGLAEYFEIDSSLLRLIMILLLFFTGIFPILITYIIAWAIIPEETEESVTAEQSQVNG